jgi:hypothetical protein
MAQNIYDQHRKAFPSVSAYVVMRHGDKVGTIAFKFPKDGASRLWVYVHWLGTPMVRGYAGGYGYDKKTAACNSASRALTRLDACGWEEAFTQALAIDNGNDWERNLRNAGFEVLQAV